MTNSDDNKRRGRPAVYEDQAARQRAYRQRQKQQDQQQQERAKEQAKEAAHDADAWRGLRHDLRQVNRRVDSLQAVALAALGLGFVLTLWNLLGRNGRKP